MPKQLRPVIIGPRPAETAEKWAPRLPVRQDTGPQSLKSTTMLTIGAARRSVRTTKEAGTPRWSSRPKIPWKTVAANVREAWLDRQ
jgi:hypothetical protein